MNFVDYCIATKNYSALNAVNEYTKSFGIKDIIKNKVDDYKLSQSPEFQNSFVNSMLTKTEKADKLKPRKGDYGYQEHLLKGIENTGKAAAADSRLKAAIYGGKAGYNMTKAAQDYLKRYKDVKEYLKERAKRPENQK